MKSNTTEFDSRNELVRTYVSELFKKHHQWRVDAVYEKAGKKFFVSPRTIKAIIKGEGIYSY